MEDGEERQGPQEPAEQGEGEGEGFDDLFDDLDRFFSPDPAEARRRREEEPPASGPEDRTEPIEEPATGEEDAAPSSEDVLPPEAGPDMTYLETRDEPPAEST